MALLPVQRQQTEYVWEEYEYPVTQGFFLSCFLSLFWWPHAPSAIVIAYEVLVPEQHIYEIEYDVYERDLHPSRGGRGRGR